MCSTSSVSAPCHASGCPCDQQRLAWCWPFLTLELIPSPTSLIPPTVMARKCLAAYRGLEFNWQFMVLYQVNKCYERVGVFFNKSSGSACLCPNATMGMALPSHLLSPPLEFSRGRGGLSFPTLFKAPDLCWRRFRGKNSDPECSGNYGESQRDIFYRDGRNVVGLACRGLYGGFK